MNDAGRYGSKHRRGQPRVAGRSSSLSRRILAAVNRLTIVDAHEHLPPEKDYLAFQYCGPNFFAGYVYNDLVSAGLPSEIQAHLRDGGDRPVEAWWSTLAPYWDKVKHGSYARAAIITARNLYGIQDINTRTIHTLAAKIRADNRPGLYRRILREQCHIRVALTCQPHTRFQDDPLLRPVPMLRDDHPWTLEGIRRHGKSENVTIRKLEDLVEADARRLARMKSEGAVGFKTTARRCAEADESEARRIFKRIMNRGTCEQPMPLNDYLFWKCLEAAGRLEVPVAVHAGLWGDFTAIAPTLMIPWARRCPRTHFDLFHLGFPNALESVVIGKNFPNVSLNLCWCYLLSQRVTLQMLDAIIDLVPLNKVIGFGGDYRVVVQKVYGHWVMACETISTALARRVEAGAFSEERALDIARMWLHDNPSAIYHV